MSHSQIELSHGWTLKQRDDDKGEWLPVKSVPSQVHIDLLANNKYVIPPLLQEKKESPTHQ
jgi:beta-mannosidase